MNYRKLRIAWSVGWGLVCLLLVVSWVHTVRNQVKGLTWVSQSHTASFVAYHHWFEIRAGKPSGMRPSHFHSNYVSKPSRLTAPAQSWQLWLFKHTSLMLLVRGQLWFPVVSCVLFVLLPWLLPLSKLRRFSLR